MSNEGGGRAYVARVTRFQPPDPHQLRQAKMPQRGSKPHFDRNHPFNAGPDVSSILKRFSFSPFRPQPAPLKNDKAPTELPIFKKKDEILRAVRLSQVTVIEAPTGSGKSTMVPKFLHDAGMNVTILGPRRLPASELATFGAEMRDEELGQTIGYRHALSSAASKDTKILYSTEGYQLVREMHEPTPADHVVIFDEFHEHTANAEILLGIFKKRMVQGLEIPKLVIMSATLDSQKVSDYFGSVPVVKVEGRRFPVTQQAQGASIAEDAVEFAKKGMNPLGFFYGKKEIEERLEEIRTIGTDAKLLPLHSQLPYEQQKLALLAHPEGKIVLATNTAQTSLTIPDSRAVLLSGLVRRLIVDTEGVQSLIIDEISQDEFWQQVGRVGRTAPGVFVSYAKPVHELKRHAPAEIQNMLLSTLVLRLAAGGEDLRELNRHLYHQVKEKNLVQAYTTLHRLGLCGPEGHVTNLGRRVSQLPVGARIGKMVIKAMDYGEQHGVDILSHAIDIAAVFESEGILAGKGRNWRRLAPGEHSSDLLVQMRVFQRALHLPTEQLSMLGIDEVNLYRARDIRAMLRRRLKLPAEEPRPAPQSVSATEEQSDNQDWRPGQSKATVARDLDDKQKTWLSRAIIEAWVDSVFQCVSRNETGDYVYKPLTGGKSAILSKDSIIGGSGLIVADRFNIGYLDDNGLQRILNLALFATRVDDLEWLENHLPPQLAAEYKDGISRARRPDRSRQERPKMRDFRRPNR